MFEKEKKEIYEANMDLYKSNLVILTFGNVSGRFDDYFIIKPSGVDYEKLKKDDMVIVKMDGKFNKNSLKPSCDYITHLELYLKNPKIKGICHTHSNYAASFAQAGISIKPLGTGHADYFRGEIPITRALKKKEINFDYEKNTAKVIQEAFKKEINLEIPSVLVKSHGVFSFGKNAQDALKYAILTEETAKINFRTILLNPDVKKISNALLDKHFNRKNGKDAIYGQNRKSL